MNKEPQIRFKGYQGEWEEIAFSETYQMASEGGTPSTQVKEYYENGKIPFVKIEDTEQKYINETNAHITQEGVNHSSAWLVHENNIIFTNGATIGNVAINKIPVTTKQGILGVVIDRDKFDLEYLYYALSSDSFQKEVEKRQSKGTFATIILSNLNKIGVSYTDFTEQQKIGAFFATLDDLIDAKEQELEKLRQLKAALLQHMFPSEEDGNTDRGGGYSDLIISQLDRYGMTISTLPNTPRIRFKGFIGPWNKKKIGDYGYISMCKRVMKNQTTSKGEIPFFKIGTFGGKADAYISRGLFEFLRNNYQYPEEGDVLISAAGTLGRAVEFDGKDQYFQDSNIVWLNHKGKLYNPFLKLVYSIVKWNSVEGSTLKRLYNTNILNTEFYVPASNEEQKLIGDFFRSQDEQINAASEQINKLKTIKQALLQKMFAA